MASPALLDPWSRLPASFGDPQGMRLKALQLEGIAWRLGEIDRSVARAVASAAGYRGPAADEFRAAMQARHRQFQRVIGRLLDARQRLARAASVVDSVESEVTVLRRRLQDGVTAAGADAVRLAGEAERMAAELRGL